MSQGDRISQGGKGTNYPYQSKVLKGLQQSIDELEDINANTALITAAVRIPNFLRPSGSAGTITAGNFSMSFASVGTADATVGGMTLKPGETINFDAGALNNTLGAVAYSTTTAGAELIITYLSL